ncbi:Sin3 binding region of histone deacetylase complex subunit SAP30 [Elsinoe australis]|uniref:Sin3 binding region of histone deacetylase complex subunit SAP30 n=1 Tax=Elsinoe australis TaxID=40998 RepID=A0A4U7BDF1_9PEZI|nr:Sin3 binding region of histone deacetylase complex subunit SAP30 [Elsinoe australis]
MAPTKKTAQDDSSASSKAPNLSAKAIGKKPANSTLSTTNSNAQKAQASINGEDGEKDDFGDTKGLSWNKEQLSNLQNYRFKNKLNHPSPYTNSLNRAVLTNPGIGQHSPTAIAMKRRAQKKDSKQDLATAVRKHFNAMPADQSAVAAGFIHRVHNQEKEFRIRSSPNKIKSGAT